MTAQTQPAITADDLGEAVGRIAAYAAMSLHESFPHLDLDELVETFTRASAIDFLSRRLLAGLHGGQSSGDAAAAAGTALIHRWADARNQARAILHGQGPTPRDWEVYYRGADGSRQVSRGHATRADADDEAARQRATGATGVKVMPAFATPAEALGYRNRHAAATADLTL
ncbi:hypothetical protein ABZ499_32870 [Streptomyces sp. NPDC019990]|uniref:hypothetical protein n=1 Tax=Streptomyces sp. NPDC019990 TaxID=3154693 RepID=UPI0033C34ABD